MSGDFQTLSSDVDSEPDLRLNRLCDRFESAWKSGPPPALEEYLAQTPAKTIASAFRELLRVDVEYRCRRSESPDAQEYLARFPQFASVICQVLPTSNSVRAGAADTPEQPRAQDDTDLAAGSEADSQATAGTLPPNAAEPAGQRFKVIRSYAVGGLGEVFVAEDNQLLREVALKQIKPRYADDANSRARFIQEGEITGRLEHPGIVPVYGMGVYADGRPFYAMRFIQGASLADAIDKFHRRCGTEGASGVEQIEFRKLLNCFVNVCNAIEYAHSRGVLHRDLKPGNIMLGKFGETLVVDWGLAKVVGRPEKAEAGAGEKTLQLALGGSGSSPTQIGSALGTPRYMSPEQAAGRLDDLRPQCDVYSLGATLYCLLCGKPPFTDRPASNLAELLRRVESGDLVPQSPLGLSGDGSRFPIPRPLEAICLKAMALQPDDRYPSAKSLADDVEHWLADEPIAALPEGASARVARWVRRRRAWALAAAVSLCAVAIVSIVAALLVNDQRWVAEQSADREKAARRSAETLSAENGILAEKEQKGRQNALELAERESKAHQAAEQLARENADLAEKEKQARLRAQRFGEASAQSAFQANSARRDAQRIAALMTEDQALRSLEQSADAAGVLTLAKALQLAPPDDPDVQFSLRTSLAGWMRQLPALSAMLKHRPEAGLIRALDVSRDGKLIVTAGDDGEAIIWSTEMHRPALAPIKPGGAVQAARFSPDGKLLVTAVSPIDAMQRAMRSLGMRAQAALPIDGKQAAEPSAPTVDVWNVEDGRLVGNLDFADPVSFLDFSDDGKVLLTASTFSFRLWRMPQREPVGPRQSLRPGADRPSDFPPSPATSGKFSRTAVGSEAGRTAFAAAQPASAVVLSPDGKWVATDGEDPHTAVIWSAAAGSMVQPQQQVAGRRRH